MASAVADIFRQAARLNLEDPRRHGNTVVIPDGLRMIFSGDIHGNRASLNKIISYAAIESNPDRRLVLQEIIHGPADPRSGYDRSGELMLRAARLKIAQPEEVLFLLGNHDVAQVTGNEITKDGCGACKSFDEGVRYGFGDDAEEILPAIAEFCLSLPLAIRTAGGVLMSHSLPSPERMELAGVEIFDRSGTEGDLRRGGPLYEWTWGRNQTDEQTEALAEQLGVEFFLLGHKPVDAGFELLTRRAAVLASDHDHGKILEFDSGETLSAESVVQCVRPIAGL